MKMKKLMTFFALISIIILAIPINSYGWQTGTDRGTILAKTDPFVAYYYGHYLPSLRGSNLINEYGAYRNIPTGVFQAYTYARHYGWNQPYNYGWNQGYNYGYDNGINTYQADTYDSDDSDWRQPYNYGRNPPYQSPYNVWGPIISNNPYLSNPYNPDYDPDSYILPTFLLPWQY